jgi:hypothetical protein
MTKNDNQSELDFQRACEIKERHKEDLFGKANVVGVGVGLRQREGEFIDEIALIVMVREKVPGAELGPDDQIPDEIEGLRVDVQEIGELRSENPLEGIE